jgi:hypothetical protein
VIGTLVKNIHPAKLFALVEVVIAAIAAFLPLTGTQVAAVLAVAAVLTGQQVAKKAPASSDHSS